MAERNPKEADPAPMLRALERAERGRGFVEPNPLVGAVLVREGQIVGEGWHERFGGPHAEVNALRAAGDKARGATLYVTLEPCEMCLGAMFHARIARAVYGAADPKKKVLKPNTAIEGGVLADDCGRILSEFFSVRR